LEEEKREETSELTTEQKNQQSSSKEQEDQYPMNPIYANNKYYQVYKDFMKPVLTPEEISRMRMGSQHKL
jgi:hypothetical protein